MFSTGVSSSCRPRLRVQRKSPVVVRATKTASDLKAELKALAGLKGGLDKTDDEKLRIVDFAKKLQDVSPPNPAEQDLAGTTWNLLFTTATDQTAGKVGPFVGTTTQEFPREKPGTYINHLTLGNGAVRIELQGIYKAAAPDRIDLEFEFIKLKLGTLQVVKKDFPPGYKGFWKCLYADEELRVFLSNKDNLIVLCNPSAGGSTYSNWNRFNSKTFQ